MTGRDFGTSSVGGENEALAVDPTPPPDLSGTSTVSSRLASLDAFRGFTMFWIIGGRAVVSALGNLGPSPIAGALAYQLTHTPWEGLRFYDIIWPAFMLMAGMSIPFSFAKRALTESRRQILFGAFRRALILFLLGSLRTSISQDQFFLVELSSALQPIGLAYLVASVLSFFSTRIQILCGASILAVYAALLSGSYENGANLVASVDIQVLGRTHPEGWGTVLSAIPTISTTILGMILGHLLRSGRSARMKMSIIASCGAGGILLGLVLSPFIPIVMKLWTVSYGLLSAGWACLGFLAFYWLMDIRGYRRWAFPFVVIGVNAIAAYVGSSVIHINHVVDIFTKGIAAQLGFLAALFSAGAKFLVAWLILLWMYRRKIYLKA